MQIKKAPETMTAVQRVRRTFAHEKTDRVTIGYEANPAVHRRLCAALGAQDDLQLYALLGVDYVQVYPRYIGPQLYPALPGRSRNPETGAVTRWVENRYGGYDDFCDFPLRDVPDEVIAAHPFPNPDDYDYEHAVRQADALIDRGFAVCIGNPGVGDILNQTGMLMGVEDALCNIATGDPATLQMIDNLQRSILGRYDRLAAALGDRASFLWIGEDLGTQHAPMISPATYAQALQPYHQRLIDMGHAHGLPVQMHSCGSSSWVYETLIAMGLDGVDTLQPEAANMSPAYLAAHFGGRLCFRGCISTAGPLASGSPAEVTAICRDTLATLMPHRGYHFAPTHAIQDNTPVENLLAMYQAAHDFGRY